MTFDLIPPELLDLMTPAELIDYEQILEAELAEYGAPDDGPALIGDIDPENLPKNATELAAALTRGQEAVRPHLTLIEETLNHAATVGRQRIILNVGPRYGKALALDTPLATPTGWTTMGDIQVGDQVFDNQGRPCNVTYVSPIWLNRPCYEVCTHDGERIIADADHEWPVRMREGRATHTITTTKIAEVRSKAARIAHHPGLDLPTADLPMHPYLLGAWLGDGSTREASITSDDVEVIEHIREVTGLDCLPRKKQATRTQTYRFTDSAEHTGRGRGPSTVRSALEWLDVWGNKHIPIAYLRADREQRMHLLQGLIDTDGYVSPTSGQVEFCSIIERLAQDVAELVWSLGAKATVVKGRATLDGVDMGPKYRVMFLMADAAWLPRKRERCHDSSTANRRYVQARPVPTVPVRCIEVDAPSHLYLAGRTMLPTHNTRKARWCILQRLREDPNCRVIYGSYSKPLAHEQTRWIRDQIEAHDLGITVRQDTRAADRWYLEGYEGGMLAAGVGTGITGFGANLLVVDDVIADDLQAMSPTWRERGWRWFTQTAFDRLEPNASVVIIMCMTGDTPVLMADGSSRSLRDVRPGDNVATYEDGRLSTSTVRNWECQGSDSILSIRMKSGVTVRANARHPFLTFEDGVEVWRRTDQLSAGSLILRATGGSGAASSVTQTDVTFPPNARECAPRITRKRVGPLAFVPLHHSIPRLCALRVSNIGTASRWLTTRAWLRSRAAFVPFVARNQTAATPVPTGTANSVSTTITQVAASVGCFATTATSPLGTGSLPKSSLPPLSTYAVEADEVLEVVPAGVEDVYDLQVDRTENFIANGLVSHNTRWHEDDLAGKLLREQPGVWTQIRIPTVAEEGDPLGREVGELLWPERFDAQAVAEQRMTLGTQGFAARHQQSPSSEAGEVWQRQWWRRFTTPLWTVQPDGSYEVDPGYTLTQSWDMSFKDAKSSDFVAGGVWAQRGANVYLLDQVVGRMSFTTTIAAVERMTKRWPQALTKLVEDKANGTAVMDALRDKITGLIPVNPQGSKYARTVAVAPMIEAGNAWLPEKSIALYDVDGFIDQCAAFPNAPNDDMVDQASQYLRRVARGGKSSLQGAQNVQEQVAPASPGSPARGRVQRALPPTRTFG